MGDLSFKKRFLLVLVLLFLVVFVFASNENNTSDGTIVTYVDKFYELNETSSNLSVISNNNNQNNNNDNVEGYYNSEENELSMLNKSKSVTNEVPSDSNEALIKEKGNVVSKIDKNNISNYYIEIGSKNNSIDNLNKFNQEIVISDKEIISYGIDLPTIWNQTIILKNNNSETKSFDINLFNYENQIGSDFLGDVEAITIFSDDLVISNSFAFVFDVESGEKKVIKIQYKKAPIKMEKTCEKLNLFDMIPKGAKIISKDISLDTILQDSCKVRFYYEGFTSYPELNFSLSEISDKKVTKVVYADKNKILDVDDKNNNVVISW